MPSFVLSFATVIDRLAQLYGEPASPAVTEPFEMVLWENVAYLASDTKRAEAFAELRRKVGVTPGDIRKAKDSVLLAVANGIMPANSLEKLRSAAEIAREFFNDNVAAILEKPIPAAKKDLRKFPSIGGPTAEKILLFNHRHPFLALDSNGLCVLVRLGHAPEHRNYATTYKGMQRALAPDLPDDCGALAAPTNCYVNTDKSSASAIRHTAGVVRCERIGLFQRSRGVSNLGNVAKL